MADSPLWLGVVGAVTGGVGALAGIGSLAWNVRSFTLQGARPKLQMVYGGVFDHDIGVMAPTERESLKQTLKGLNTAIDPDASLRTDRLVAGLRVRNRGRAPLQVSGISWRTPDSSRRDNAHLKFEGAPQMPTAIPPAGETIFYVALEVLNKQIALCKTWSDQPQQIWLEIWNANGEYRSENVPSEILALAPSR